MGRLDRARTWVARAGTRMRCECCGRRSARFLPFGDPLRPNARCAWCGCLERHRVLWPYLRQTIKPGDRILHIAPEPIIARNIAALDRVTYTVADLNPSNAWLVTHLPIVRADVVDLPWPDGSFDLVVLSHVLEYVPDDARAMRELRRVVALDGVVISQEGHYPDRETLELPASSAPIRGDTDYVRVYGRDLPERWCAAGFEIRKLFAHAGPANEIFEARPS